MVIGYRLARIELAVDLVRPGAKFVASYSPDSGDLDFKVWEDERPIPSTEEILDILSGLALIEDAARVIYTEDQKLSLGIDE